MVCSLKKLRKSTLFENLVYFIGMMEYATSSEYLLYLLQSVRHLLSPCYVELPKGGV